MKVQTYFDYKTAKCGAFCGTCAIATDKMPLQILCEMVHEKITAGLSNMDIQG